MHWTIQIGQSKLFQNSPFKCLEIKIFKVEIRIFLFLTVVKFELRMFVKFLREIGLDNKNNLEKNNS